MEWDELSGSVAVAICSHDCDVENPRSRTGIIVAPLCKVPARPGEDLYARILASGDTSTELNYINLFPFVHKQGDTTLEAVIDFSAITSIAKAEKALPMLAKSRVLGCDDDTREAIGRKLAMFFGRPPQAPRVPALPDS